MCVCGVGVKDWGLWSCRNVGVAISPFQPGKVVLDQARAWWMSPVPECTWNLVFVNILRICGPLTCASSLLGSSHSRGWVEGGNADAPFLGQSGPLTLNTMPAAPLEILGLRFLAPWSLSYSQVCMELYSEPALWYSDLDNEICFSGCHYTQNWSPSYQNQGTFWGKGRLWDFLNYAEMG